MKAYEVGHFEVRRGIKVEMEPFPHIVLGWGGHKTVTRVPIGRRDANTILKDIGNGKIVIKEAGVLRVKDTGKHIIIAPANQSDNRVLVLWHVVSGFRGRADITAPDGVTVIAYDHSWHSPRGSLGETAEMLAILSPGQTLVAEVSGRRVQDTRLILKYDEETGVYVTTPDRELCEGAEGEII